MNYVFGYRPAAGDTPASTNKLDLTNTPYSPLMPGRFNVLRDFHMILNPGGSTDRYKQCYIKQK